jgi:SAM-dependent methyltransferase
MDSVQTRLGTRVESNKRPPSDELLRQLASEPEWMYPWELAPGVVAPVHADHLTAIHETRLAMMEPAVREVLLAAKSGEGAGGTVIDLACNEGWFSHRALDYGAAKVLGVDIRDVNVRRANLVAEQLGLAGDHLEFRQGDVFDLDPEEVGTFDVVFLLGLIYHLEDPMGAIRKARSLCKRLCVIETQLTRYEDQIEWGRGKPHRAFAPASFAAFFEHDANENPVASAPGILSLIPNRAAVEEMGRTAGFSMVEEVEPTAAMQSQFIDRDRGLFLAWV